MTGSCRLLALAALLVAGERAVSRWLPAPLPPGAPRARHRSLRDPAVCTSRGEPVAAAGRSGLRRILERVVRPLERCAARRPDADLRRARAARRAGTVPDRVRHRPRHRARAGGRAAGDGATVELWRYPASYGGRLRRHEWRPAAARGEGSRSGEQQSGRRRVRRARRFAARGGSRGVQRRGGRADPLDRRAARLYPRRARHSELGSRGCHAAPARGDRGRLGLRARLCIARTGVVVGGRFDTRGDG